MKRLLVLACFVFALLPMGATAARAQPQPGEPLTVFAASSLKNVFDVIGRVFTLETGVDIVFSYAGTSVLARQIEQGAPADVFASANDDWTDYLLAGDALSPGTTQAFASNTLVLIAPGALSLEEPLELSSADGILEHLGEDGRLAVALVDAVPAGLYARQALEALGLWEVLAPRLAQADNVRATLRLVALGEAPLGIVYASDARADDSVQVVADIPASSHAPIRYTASAVGAQPSQSARDFVAFLVQSQAQFVLLGEGFQPAPRDDPRNASRDEGG